MTSKERIIAVLNGEIPDRIPHGDNGFTSEFYYEVTGKKTLCYGGWDELEALWSGDRDRVVQDYVDALCTMAEIFEWDYIRVPAAPKKRDYSCCKRLDERHYQDENGRVLKFDPTVGHIACYTDFDTDMEVEDLPDPDAPFEVDDSEMDIVRGVYERVGQEKFILGRMPGEATFPYGSTVGMEEYLVRMIVDPEFVHASTKVHMARAVKYIDAFLDAGCDGVQELADYGDNRSIFMGKARYDEFIAPYLKILCDRIHAKGGYFIKHTDGFVMDLLPSFIEMGIDGWHGIQPAIGMEIKKIRERIGNRFCLWGGVDVDLMIKGTPEEIKRLVRRAVKYSPDGALVLTIGNVIEQGTKKENYLALLEQLKEIYTFPIDHDAIPD